MNRNQLVDRCKAIIKEAYEEATEMIVAYLELHPKTELKALCIEIDEENWSALDARVRRRRDARKASNGAETLATRAQASAVRHAKVVLRKAEPEELAELLDDPEIRQNVAAAQQVRELRQENRTGIPARNTTTGPTFLSIVLKVNGWLDELIGMAERGEAHIPDEFSTQSISDMGIKAMRLKELVDDARENSTVSVA